MDSIDDTIRSAPLKSVFHIDIDKIKQKMNLRLPINSPPGKAAEVSGNSPPVATLSRSEKTTTGVMFSCICGENVHGILLIENGIPTKIKCCNCGCLHHGSEKPFLVANFGTDCKHPVRTYDPLSHEFTCNECFQVIPGTLKLRAVGTSLPDGIRPPGHAGGAGAGSRPPRRTEA
ncbi:hypothetical protein KA005_54000 [bacterium]|nr:hypothetical protein [bacterium]